MRTFFTLLFCITSFALWSQDCLPGWNYYREIEINNPGSTLSDYQVQIIVNTNELVMAGNLQSDGDDLRFTDEACNELPFFADSLATNDANAIWVNVPDLPSGSTTIRMYYGNSDAVSAADPDATFLFYDDFEDGEIDPAKWETVGGFATFEVVDGVLNYASDGSNPGPRFKFARTVPSFSGPVTLDFAAEITNSNGFGFSSADEILTRILFRQSGFGFDTINLPAIMEDTFSNGYAVETMYPLIRYPRFSMENASITAGVVNDTLNVYRFQNFSSNSENVTTTYQLEQLPMSGFHFIVSSFLDAQTIYLDYLRVRKALPDVQIPSTSVGDEQSNPASSQSDLSKNMTLDIFPNPTNHYWTVNLPNGTSDIRLYDADGQLVNQWHQPTSVSFEINARPLPTGMYLLQVIAPDGIRTAKLVKGR
jgi:hypothetical protein